MALSAHERDALVAAYPGARAAVDALYDVPGVLHAEPAVVFDLRRDSA